MIHDLFDGFSNFSVDITTHFIFSLKLGRLTLTALTFVLVLNDILIFLSVCDSDV